MRPIMKVPAGVQEAPPMEMEAELFKALSDPTRLRIAAILSLEGEVCVCNLAEALEVPDFSISRHLRVLRAAGLVKARRQGTWMHYRLAPARSKLEACLLGCFGSALGGHATVKADLKRLSRATCARR